MDEAPVMDQRQSQRDLPPDADGDGGRQAAGPRHDPRERQAAHVFADGHHLMVDHGPLLIGGAMLVLTGIQLVCTGLIGEVLMRTYFESQNRPIYSIREIISQELKVG